MKKLLSILFFLAIHINLFANEPLKDYSFIRGVCYPSGWMNDVNVIERDLGYAKRLNINSTRIWLSYKRYQSNPAGFIQKLQLYIRTANSLGISTMPVLLNGNMLDPAILKDEFHEIGDKYVKDIVNALKDEKGILAWDIMNEPSCNDYYMEAPVDVKQTRWNEIDNFVRYYCKLVKKLDSKNAITVGHTFPVDLEIGGDLVDVLSFHDYLATQKQIENSYQTAEQFAKKFNKPLINSELGCIGRANPYDLALKICEEHKAGWYVYELMVNGYWGDIHGLVYADGTVRDPSIISAIMGFYRNLDSKTRIKANPNKEGHATKAIKMVEDALKQDTRAFRNRQSSTDDILEAAEYCANLLESAEMVPMIDQPSVKIKTWRAMNEKDRDVSAIRAFAYELGLLLKKYCLIY